MQEKSIGLYLFSAQFAKTRWRYRCKCLHSKTKLKFFLNHLFEARAHLSKNIRAVHSWVADNLKICLQLITGKNFRDENESYEDVEEFNHDDFLELGFNANHIGRLIAKIKVIAVDYGNLDIVSIVDSAGTKKMILGTIPFEESKNMDDTILAAKLQQNIEMAKRENYYAPVTAMLIPLLDSFLEILQAALFAMDQTSLGFGGCGLNYASVGIDSVPLVYESDQPRLCSSVIIGQIGARKLAPAIVFPTQSKDPVRNAEIIRELYNGTDAIPDDRMIWTRDGASCDGEIMAEYAAYHLKTMVPFRKLYIYDAVSLNDDFKVLATLDKFNTKETVVASHFTSTGAAPDDLFMSAFKDGTDHSNGTKLDITYAYKGLGRWGKNRKKRDDILKTLPISTVREIIEVNHAAVGNMVIPKSNIRVGNLLMIHYPVKYTLGLKKTLKRVLVTDPETIKVPVEDKKSPAEIKNLLNACSQQMKKEKGNRVCLAPGCGRTFTTIKAQRRHTSRCSKWKNVNGDILESRRMVAELTENPGAIERSKKIARKHREERGKSVSTAFHCPGKNCTKCWKSWYNQSTKISIISHVTSCAKVNDTDLTKIFYSHNVFKKYR